MASSQVRTLAIRHPRRCRLQDRLDQGRLTYRSTTSALNMCFDGRDGVRVVYCGGSSIGGGGRREGEDEAQTPFITQYPTLHLQFSAQFAAQRERLVGSFENSGFKIDGLVLTFQLSFALGFASVFSNVNAPIVRIEEGFQALKNVDDSGCPQLYRYVCVRHVHIGAFRGAAARVCWCAGRGMSRCQRPGTSAHRWRIGESVHCRHTHPPHTGAPLRRRRLGTLAHWCMCMRACWRAGAGAILIQDSKSRRRSSEIPR